MSHQRVMVVRPKRSVSVALTTFVLSVFFRGLLIMLCAPAIDWHPGYWTSVVVGIGATALFYRNEYLSWTVDK